MGFPKKSKIIRIYKTPAEEPDRSQEVYLKGLGDPAILEAYRDRIELD